MMDTARETRTGHLADTILRLRLMRGWTQAELAGRCTPTAPALTRGTIAKIEAGVRRDVTLTEATALATVFGVPLSDFASPPQTSRGEAP